MTDEMDIRQVRVDIMKRLAIDLLGPTGTLDEVCKALPTDTLENVFSYILKNYDIDEVLSYDSAIH